MSIFRYAHFYSESPWQVWTTTPMEFVERGLSAISAIRAEESLRRIDEIAVGTGSFQHKGQARRVIQRWQSDMKGGRGGHMPKTAQGFANMMMGLGIPGQVVK